MATAPGSGQAGPRTSSVEAEPPHAIAEPASPAVSLVGQHHPARQALGERMGELVERDLELL